MTRATEQPLKRHELRVIRAFARYPIPTARQATLAAGYPMTSRKHVAEALTLLTARHFLDTRRVPDDGADIRLNREWYWFLRQKGIDHLSKAGFDVLPRGKHDPQKAAWTLKHILAVNDVLIACERFSRESVGNVMIRSLTHDLYLARSPFPVTLSSGTSTNLHADGYVELKAYGYQYNLWLELDRGTEHKDKWQAKVEAIVRHAQTLGETPLTVMVVTTAGLERSTKLAAWTAELLTVMERHGWADLFRFTDVDLSEPDTVMPSDFLIQPRWMRPSDDVLYPLIEAPGEAWP